MELLVKELLKARDSARKQLNELHSSTLGTGQKLVNLKKGILAVAPPGGNKSWSYPGIRIVASTAALQDQLLLPLSYNQDPFFKFTQLLTRQVLLCS